MDVWFANSGKKYSVRPPACLRFQEKKERRNI